MKKADIIKSNLLGHFPDDLDKEIDVDETVQVQKLKMSTFNDEPMCDPHYQLKST